ncbi:MAG: GAP family protein [Pseudomonadota bacterium]|nr:GAP family protein [Pseudomonadota bacterium]
MLLVVMLLVLAAAKKPVQSGLCLLGGALVYFLLISGLVLVIGSSLGGGEAHPKPTWRLVRDMVLGLLFVWLAVHAARATPHPEKAAKLQKYITKFASRSPLQLFLAGFVVQVTAVKSLAFLSVALKQITDAQLGIMLSSLALVMYLMISCATYELPVLLYIAVPERAGILVGRVNA